MANKLITRWSGNEGIKILDSLIKTGDVEKIWKELPTLPEYEMVEERFDLRGICFKESETTLFNIAEANLEFSEFIGVRFLQPNFSGVFLKNSLVEKSTFDDLMALGAVLYNCNITGSKLLKCDFSNTLLNKVTFYECDLKRVKFSFSTGQEMIFEKCTLSDCEFEETNLERLLLKNCEISNTSFKNALLENGKIESTQWKENQMDEISSLKGTLIFNSSGFSKSETELLIKKGGIVSGASS